MENDVAVLSVLLHSPYVLMEREDINGQQTFFQMLSQLIAPYYKFKSLTTILMSIGAILYVSLVCHYPPYLRIPAFSLESLQLIPQNLRHFQFYRIFTAQFLYPDIATFLVCSSILWSLGSYTEETMGWKLIIIFCSLSGLVGSSTCLTIPTFLLGCNFALSIMKWPDPNTPILYRKIMLVIYIVLSIAYVLYFYDEDRSYKYSIYASTLTGISTTFIVGAERDPVNLTTVRKILKATSTLGFVCVYSTLIIRLVFSNQTFI